MPPTRGEQVRERSSGSPAARGRGLLLPAGVAILFAGLPLADIVLFGFPRLFRYLAADSYYYLTVAANFPLTGVLTFDQSLPTNGFHPLWQWLLAGAFPLLSMFPDPRAPGLWTAFFLSLALGCAGIALVARECRRWLGGADLLLLLLPTGFVAALAGPFHLRYAAAWNLINGMESGLVLLLFGWTAACFLRREDPVQRPALRTGLALGLLILARLDLVLFLPALAVVLWMECPGRDRRERRSVLLRGAASLGVATALLGSYLVWNRWTSGSFLPVSGSLKTTFPAPDAGKLEFFRRLLASGPGDEEVWAQSWRFAWMLLPLALAVGYLLGELRRVPRRGIEGGIPRSSWRSFLALVAIQMAALHLYDLLFVPIWAQGHWYYPVSSVASTLLAADLLARLGPVRALLAARRGQVASALVLSQVLYFGLVFLAPVPLQQRLGWDLEEPRGRFFQVFEDRQRVRAFYGGDPPPFVEMDDGILAYSLGSPALSGLGFCLDREAAAAHRAGNLLMLAWRRGYRRAGFSNYLNDPFFFGAPTPEEVTAVMHRVAGHQDYRPFRWSMEYAARDGSYFLLRFDPLFIGS